jgi:hypothetical protein
VKVDPTGFLQDPDLHDGLLTALDLVDEKTLHIRASDVRGGRHTIELHGLSRLLAAEFREGNIILDVQIETAMPPDEQTIRHLAGEHHASVGEPHRSKHESYVRRLIQSVASGELTLVTIGSSYGCSLAALCQKAVARDG